MAIEWRSKSGINARYSNPFSFSELSSDGGDIGSGLPTDIIIIVGNDAPVIPHVGSLSLAPGPFLSSSVDSDGNVGVIVTYTGTGPSYSGPPDGIHYIGFDGVHTINVEALSGFFQQELDVILVSTNNPTVTVTAQVYTSDDVLPIDDPPTAPPSGILPPTLTRVELIGE